MDNEPIYRGTRISKMEGNQIRLPADSSYHNAAGPLYATKMICDDDRWVDIHSQNSSGIAIPLELIVNGQSKKLGIPPDIKSYLGIESGSQVVLLAYGNNFFEVWKKEELDRRNRGSPSLDKALKNLELRGIRLD